MDKHNSPIKHFIIMFGGTFLNLLIGLFTTPIITRLVNPEQYGQLSVFNMYAGIALMIFCAGLDQALVRFFYTEDSQAYRIWILKKCTVLPIVSWVLFAVSFILLEYLGIIDFEFDTTITIILAICILFQILNRFSVLLLRLQYNSGKYSLINVFHKIIYVVLVIVLIKLINGQDIIILTIATTITYAICFAIAMLFERNIWFVHTAYVPSKVKVLDLIKYGTPFILSMGITTLFQSIDKISLNYYCNYSEVGIYSSAMSLVHIFALLQTTINAIWAPMATEHYEKDKEDKSFYTNGNAYITIFMFFTGICLIFGKDMFAFILGEKYRASAYILPCLCFNPIMYTISETTVNGINFAKKSYLHILVAVIACLTNIVGNTILVPIIGSKGAAISTGISYIVFFTARTLFANKYYNVDYKLKRFYALTAVVLLFALYNTFVKFNVGTVIFFIVCLLALIVLYKNDCINCVKMILKMKEKIILKIKKGER